MAYVYYNPNPYRLSTEDCTVRAVSAVLRVSWENAFDLLADTAKEMGLMPSNRVVTWALLKMYGFHREALPDHCPDCYTVSDFARDHPRGVYVCATSDHVIAIVGGDWHDAWNSGDEVPLFYWQKMIGGK